MPRTISYDTLKIVSVNMEFTPTGQLSDIVISYRLTSSADATLAIGKSKLLQPNHPWLAGALGSALAATDSRSTAVSQLVTLLLANLEVEEGI